MTITAKPVEIAIDNAPGQAFLIVGITKDGERRNIREFGEFLRGLDADEGMEIYSFRQAEIRAKAIAKHNRVRY